MFFWNSLGFSMIHIMDNFYRSYFPTFVDEETSLQMLIFPQNSNLASWLHLLLIPHNSCQRDTDLLYLRGENSNYNPCVRINCHLRGPLHFFMVVSHFYSIRVWPQITKLQACSIIKRKFNSAPCHRPINQIIPHSPWISELHYPSIWLVCNTRGQV